MASILSRPQCVDSVKLISSPPSTMYLVCGMVNCTSLPWSLINCWIHILIACIGQQPVSTKGSHLKFGLNEFTIMHVLFKHTEGQQYADHIFYLKKMFRIDSNHGVKFFLLCQSHTHFLVFSGYVQNQHSLHDSCHIRSQFYPPNTWHNNSFVITSKRRHFDAVTSKWRRFHKISTSLLLHVSAG